MNFTATVDGLTFDQPALFEAHMKATHKGALKNAEVRRTFSQGRTGWTVPKSAKPSPLNAVEKEWLGVWVRDSIGGLGSGQVWAMSAKKFGYQYVWVILGGELVERSTTELERLAGRDGEPPAGLFDPRYCATCGEHEGSVYARYCCTDDQMIEN